MVENMSTPLDVIYHISASIISKLDDYSDSSRESLMTWLRRGPPNQSGLMYSANDKPVWLRLKVIDSFSRSEDRRAESNRTDEHQIKLSPISIQPKKSISILVDRERKGGKKDFPGQTTGY